MPDSRQSASSVIRFGPFDADLHTQELRKHGVRVRLPGQSFQVLKMLLDRQGTLVTREELRQALWPSDTFVDFDHGLSAAVNRLREAIGDSAEEPHYVETLPRRGYRFIGKITLSEPTPLPQATNVTLASGEPATATANGTSAASTGWRWSRIASLLLVVATCTLLATLAFFRWHRPTSAAITPVPFTALPGWAGCPAFSPDGSRIAFKWNGKRGSTSFDLYVKAVGNESLLRLTNHPSDDICAAWSPDGKQIAFRRAGRDDNGIYVIPASGGQEQKLHAMSGPWEWDSIIGWSPDGKSIAYTDSPLPYGHRRLHLLRLETLESTQIEHDERCQEESLPAFSNDGKLLAYVCLLAQGGSTLSVVTSIGASPRVLKTLSGFVDQIAWTRDDKSLIFLQREKITVPRLVRELSVATGSIEEIPLPINHSAESCCGGGAGGLAVSPRGQRLAYTFGAGGNINIWRADLLHPRNPPVKLIASTRYSLCPSYSPDGHHIAFCSDRGGTSEIWMSDADGTSLEQLTDLKDGGSGTPSWSPDGKQIVFDHRSSIGENKVHADLYIIDVTERVPRKLLTGTEEASVPSWSRDGKWIYFIDGGDDGGNRVFRVSPKGGQAQLLTPTHGYIPQESFDRKRVYFATLIGDTTVQAASLNPSGTEFPVDGIPLLWAGTWKVVRDGIYFFPLDASRMLSYFDFATKQVRPVLEINEMPGYGMSVSPDGRYVLYSQLGDFQGDIMLVDHFR
jgi:Tol biopolymer transport system component/DNA-binding winged helix-turn-helix (wHTH) protein